MNIEKGFENNKLFLESIEAEAIGQSNGILNSAYLAVGYLKTLINSKLLTVDSANKSGISVSKVLDTVKKFEEDDIIYFGSTYVNKIIISNIHKEARKVDDCIVPVYMDTILSEMYKLDIEIVKYKFSEVFKGFDIFFFKDFEIGVVPFIHGKSFIFKFHCFICNLIKKISVMRDDDCRTVI